MTTERIATRDVHGFGFGFKKPDLAIFPRIWIGFGFRILKILDLDLDLDLPSLDLDLKFFELDFNMSGS